MCLGGGLDCEELQFNNGDVWNIVHFNAFPCAAQPRTLTIKRGNITLTCVLESHQTGDFASSAACLPPKACWDSQVPGENRFFIYPVCHFFHRQNGGASLLKSLMKDFINAWINLVDNEGSRVVFIAFFLNNTFTSDQIQVNPADWLMRRCFQVNLLLIEWVAQTSG